MILKTLIVSSILFYSVLSAQPESEVKVADGKMLDSLINKRDGKVLLINVWATWCIPCREEFPDLIKLSDVYKNDVEIIGISIDYPDEIESKIIPFMIQNNVNFEIIVNGFKKDEELINYLDDKWSGVIPASFIFNKNGEKIFSIEGKKSYDFFKEKISALIQE